MDDMPEFLFTAWTDYPFKELGDTPYEYGPIREVKVLSYDGDRYTRILVEGRELEVKYGYLQLEKPNV